MGAMAFPLYAALAALDVWNALTILDPNAALRLCVAVLVAIAVPSITKEQYESPLCLGRGSALLIDNLRALPRIPLRLPHKGTRRVRSFIRRPLPFPYIVP
jgi:hypothetical protein